jgi:flagellar motor switch protein FliN/FliY
MAEEQTPDADAVPPASPDDAAAAAVPTPDAPVDAPDTIPPIDLSARSDSAAVSLDSFSIDELLSQASFEDPATFGGAAAAGADAAPGAADGAADFKLPSFQQAMQDAQASSIDLLRDVELNVKIELGRSRMLVEDVLKLAEGSVVELDKLAGDPVDVFVNDRLVARGEVLVLNDNFCVRVNEIVAGAKEEAM